MYFDFAQYKQKGQSPILIIVGILVVGLIAGGAYYLGTQKSPASPTKRGEQTPVVTQTPQPSPSATENIVAKFTINVISSGKTETIVLNPTDNGKQITVGVGTYIYLRFGFGGNYKFTINPPSGILEIPQGRYNLPIYVNWQAKAVGVGTAEVTVVAQTPNNINRQCSKDSDCSAVNVTRDLSNPCANACIDYSSKEVIGVNEKWLEQQWGGPPKACGVMCTTQVYESQKTHEVKCINSVCQVVPVTQ